MEIEAFRALADVTPRELLGKFLRTMPIVWGLALPTAVFGFMDENHPCQVYDKNEPLSMSMWLKIVALSSFTVTFFDLVILLIVGFGKAKISLYEVVSIFFTIDLMFFGCAWLWGVSVAFGYSKCIHQGTGMGVMTIIQMIVGGLRFYYFHTPMYIIAKKVSEGNVEDNYADLENQIANRVVANRVVANRNYGTFPIKPSSNIPREEGEEEKICPISQEQIKENDICYKLKCGHIFGQGITKWWDNGNRKCPVCRCKI